MLYTARYRGRERGRTGRSLCPFIPSQDQQPWMWGAASEPSAPLQPGLHVRIPVMYRVLPLEISLFWGHITDSQAWHRHRRSLVVQGLSPHSHFSPATWRCVLSVSSSHPPFTLATCLNGAAYSTLTLVLTQGAGSLWKLPFVVPKGQPNTPSVDCSVPDSVT